MKWMGVMPLDRRSEKRRIRELAHANRAAQADKEEISRVIVRRLEALSEYQAARSVAFYVDVRDEVRTRFALPRARARTRRSSFRIAWRIDCGCFICSMWMS